MNYVKAVAEKLALFVDTHATENDLVNLRDQAQADSILLHAIAPTVNNLSTQLNQMPLSSQTGGHSGRKPKIGEPPEFNGVDGKVTFHEWLNKIDLWIVHEDIVTDRHRITVAMNRLTGAASKYMEPWIKTLTSGGIIGTWAEFVNELNAQYGQHDDKEGAKKELTALFNNKDLATKNFIKYDERFRTLGRITGYDDELLIDKLDHVIEKDM